MEIKIKHVDDTIVAVITGKIDTATAPQLDAELYEACESADALRLDFTLVSYVSSAGLRILLRLHKLMAPKKGLSIVGVNESVLEVFEITGFSDILTLE